MEARKIDKSLRVRAAELLARALETEKQATADLLEVLQAERVSIIEGKVEELYAGCRLRAERTEPLRAAQVVTAEVISGLAAPDESGAPRLSAAISRVEKDFRPRLRRLREDVNRLRREVAAMSEENRRQVADVVDYIDGAVAILTGADAGSEGYGTRRAKSGPSVISSEV
ncbi:MAG: flagellar export chaperone FlgN [Pseudomonadota bacterium]